MDISPFNEVSPPSDSPILWLWPFDIIEIRAAKSNAGLVPVLEATIEPCP